MAFCTNCGAELVDNTLFCVKCGHKVGAPITNTSVSPQKAPVSAYVSPAQNTATYRPAQAAALSSRQSSAYAPPAVKKSKEGLMAGIAALAVLVAVGVSVCLFVLNSNSKPTMSTAEARSTSGTAATVPDNEESGSATVTGESEVTSGPIIPSGQPTTSAGIGASTLLNSEYSIRANIPTAYTLVEYYDGNAVWSSSDGNMHIIASGMRNENNWSLDEYRSMREEEYRNIEYSPTGDNWFVLSGDDNGETYYVKCYVGSSYIKSIAFSYESSKSGDEVIEQVYSSIDVGSL